MALISSPSPTKQAKEGTSTLPFSLNQPTLTTNPFFSQHTQTDNSLSSMEKPRLETQQILSPSSSGRRRSSSSYSSRSNDLNSPEFEFWMVRNPSFPAPNLLSADELFVDGVILPLCLISNQPNDPTDEEEEEEEEQEQDNHSKDPQTPNLELKQTQQQNPEPETVAEEVPPARGGAEPGPGPGPGPEPSTVFSSSKRWRDIFKVGEKKNGSTHEERGEKEKKKDRKSSSSNGGSSAGTELNINIWPFSRSRSAGNSGNRPKMGGGAAVTRKVSSAPCSRSNSRGESKSKKWPTSPSRGIGVGGGIHLGRSSPVWQVRRGGVAAAAAVGGGGSGLKTSEPVTVPPPMVVRKEEKAVKKEGVDSRWSKSRFSGGGTGSISGGLNLNLNVPMCMGARQNSCCRSEENSKLVGGGGVEESSSGGGGVNGGNGGKLFNLRTLFSKKSVVLSN